MKINLFPYYGKSICVGLSGGGDSMALLHYLVSNMEEFSIRVSAVNCEHGIRGEQSLADTAFVQNYCKQKNIPLYLYSADCLALAKKEKKSIETAARDFRYACYQDILSSGKADCIATAHHALDQAETMIFRLARGTSLAGLCGIEEREKIIRPFLQVSKAEITEYLSINKIPYCQDESNFDTAITRNAIRLNILPQLENVIVGATKNIAKFSLLAKEDEKCLSSLADKIIKKQDFPLCYFIQFCEEPAIFKRAALKGLKGLGVEKDYTSEHLTALFALQEQKNGTRVNLPCGIEGVREYKGICLYRPIEKVMDEIPLTETSILGEWKIQIKPWDEKKEKGTLLAEKDRIPKNAIVRMRRDGDEFYRFGGTRQKLKEYFINQKIPRRLRDNIPVIAVGKEIYAVCGMEISESIKAEKNVVKIILTEK